MGAAGPEDAKEVAVAAGKSSKPKICILGGGVAGLTTAWALTWQSKEDKEAKKELPYEVHLFQMGWRMGGKGRTGRQEEHRHRVIEHGLHALGGYYHNTFRMLRKLSRWDAIEKEFVPTSRVAFPVELPPPSAGSKSGRVGTVAYDWPSPDGSPHDPKRHPGEEWRVAPNVADLVGRMARYLEGLDLVDLPGKRTPAARGEYALPPLNPPAPPEHREVVERRSGSTLWNWNATAGQGEEDAAGWDLASKERLRGLLGRAARLADDYGGDAPDRRDGSSASDASMKWLAADALALLEDRPDRDAPEHAGWMRSGLISPSRAERQALWRNITRLCLASVVGIISSEAITRGLEELDCMEFRDFLRINGASERTVHSGVVKGIYDYAFAYEGGDPDKPSLAAGVAVRFMLLFFLDSVGGLQFHMVRGMGESLILPIYEELEEKVSFHPYYEARSLILSEDGRRIAQVNLHAQLDSKMPHACANQLLSTYPQSKDKFWPDRPGLSQTTTGDPKFPDEVWALEAPAIEPAPPEVRTDFDHVVLAIPPAAHEKMLPDALRDQWKTLFDPKHNVATLSAQVWGDNPHAPEPFILVGREGRIFQSIADMSHQLNHEIDPHPKQLYFLVGTAQRNVHSPSRALSESIAQESAELFFEEENKDLEVLRLEWKTASPSDSPNHVQRNERPSDLYVRSAPHTISKRPGTRVRGVDNLVLAGDWVRTGIDFGCVEAAVISGLRAANVIRDRYREDELDIYEAGGPVGKRRSE